MGEGVKNVHFLGDVLNGCSLYTANASNLITVPRIDLYFSSVDLHRNFNLLNSCTNGAFYYSFSLCVLFHLSANHSSRSVILIATRAARPTICGGRRLLLIGAPPPIICRRAADAIVAVYLFCCNFR